jgi:protein tyrosine phosphatase (PTP) superfamily phosphohydrolase (DUF442 family)
VRKRFFNLVYRTKLPLRLAISLLVLLLTFSGSVLAHFTPHHPQNAGNNRRADGDQGRRRKGNRYPNRDRRWNHGWRGWRPYWDRRWYYPWGNVWYDNDVYLDDRYIYRNNSCTGENQTVTSTSPSDIDIPNFHEVHPWLFRGGQPTEDGLEQLSKLGVKTIIDLRTDPEQAESERQLCQHHDLQFINIPVDKNAGPTKGDVGEFMNIVERHHANSAKGAVFVHCHHGSDRVGGMVALYRELGEDQYSFDRAYKEMLAYGFHDNLSGLKKAVQLGSGHNFEKLDSLQIRMPPVTKLHDQAHKPAPKASKPRSAVPHKSSPKAKPKKS